MRMSSILERSLKRNGGRKSSLSRRIFSRKKRQRRLKHSKRTTNTHRVKSEKERIDNFLDWCSDVGIELHPNVSIGREGSCDGLGVVAKSEINVGECLALIPRTTVLSCSNSKIKDLVIEDNLLKHGSSWIPLLLSLAAEYSSKTLSPWYPYLSLVPNHTNPLPMLWMKSERKRLLAGTGLEHWITRDLKKIEHDFETNILPFMQRHESSLYKKRIRHLKVYEKMVAFVMSYSFTDEETEDFLGRTMMVPFVDLLNHSSYHHVELTYHPSCLKLIAIRNIGKGEEVMNTYGNLSNADLLHLYGFTERDNPYDEAVITSDLVKEVCLQLSSNSKRWDTIVSMGLVEDEYTINTKGEADADLLLLIRLILSKEKIKEVLSEYTEPLSLEDCSLEELNSLKTIAKRSLDKYPEQVTLSSLSATMTTKEGHCHRVTLGQQESLRKLITALTT